MNELLELFVKIAVTVAAVYVIITILYRRASYNVIGKSQPDVAIFPKYEGTFDCAPDDIRRSLTALRFEASGKNENVFKRGKVDGDLSAGSIRVRVEIDPAQKKLRVLGQRLVLFDTGDLWQLTEDIIAGATSQDS